MNRASRSAPMSMWQRSATRFTTFHVRDVEMNVEHAGELEQIDRLAFAATPSRSRLTVHMTASRLQEQSPSQLVQ